MLNKIVPVPVPVPVPDGRQAMSSALETALEPLIVGLFSLDVGYGYGYGNGNGRSRDEEINMVRATVGAW